MKELKVSKAQVLQRKGDLNTKVYQVKSGLLRSYSIDEKGKEHIYMFAPEEWIIGDSKSPDVPCDLYIDALEDSVLIQREKKIDSSNSDISAHKLFKRMEVLQTRIIMLMSASVIERYEHFLESYPNIVQRVPQRMIASYLGITPETLSAVKKTELKK